MEARVTTQSLYDTAVDLFTQVSRYIGEMTATSP